MVAARWTAHAEDITDKPDQWPLYLTLQQLAHALNLEPGTITDALTRSFSRADPRSAINPPAARIGGRVGATPMWKPEQATRYRKLAKDRAREQVKARKKSALPVVSAVDQAERNLVTMNELVERTGHPKSTINKWIRQYDENAEHPFPAAVGIAQRVPPVQMGPPRPLRDYDEVVAWIAAYKVRAKSERGGFPVSAA